jgi:hypothetical protein
MAEEHRIHLDILAQPNDITCGPTCLEAIYRYYSSPLPLEEIIDQVHAFEGGGTLAVWLACHALKRKYEATIYTYNVQLFDPSWFLPPERDLVACLKEQIKYKQDARLILATHAYLEYFELGGKVKLEDLTREMLLAHLLQDGPILTGLNSNFLYRSPREYGIDNILDDIRGEPAGHFVILSGYNKKTDTISVVDPLMTNPYSITQKYDVAIDRVICSILLGILTHDANFLILKPKK